MFPGTRARPLTYPVGETDPVGVGDGDVDPELDPDADGDVDPLGDGLVESEADADGDGLVEADPEGDVEGLNAEPESVGVDAGEASSPVTVSGCPSPMIVRICSL